MLTGPERLGPGLAHPSHVTSQMPLQDHGDWTFEEQFKQVGRVLGVRSLGGPLITPHRPQALILTSGTAGTLTRLCLDPV